MATSIYVNNVFSILPAPIRYNPDLSDFAKLLWSEIYVLNFQGVTKIKNGQLSKNLNKTKVTISRGISELLAHGLIIIDGINNDRIMKVAGYNIEKQTKDEYKISQGETPEALLTFYDSWKKKEDQ